MTVLFNYVLPILAGIAILAMIFFIWRAFSARSQATHQAYNVGRQEALKSSRVNLVRAVFALMFALILLGAIGISPTISNTLPVSTATPQSETPPPTKMATVAPTETEIPPTFEPSPTSPKPTSTNTPMPTNTSTPEPTTATVNSGVGVWLRVEPGVDTDQLEWLLDGTVVTLLDNQRVIDELVWQQVQTESGVTGWVAADFIVVDES